MTSAYPWPTCFPALLTGRDCQGMPVRYMLRTSLPDSPGTYLGLDDIMLNSSNFYDEDGKPSSWRDVLAAAFQPLSLRLIQRGGVLYVYDLSVPA